MNSENTSKKKSLSGILNNSYVRLLVSVLVLYLGIMLSLPSAGVVRSFPLLILLSGFSGMIYSDKKSLCGFSFILAFCMYCIGGYTMYFAFGYAVLSAVFTLFGLVIFNRIHLVRKSEKKQYKARYAKQLALVTLVSLVSFFVFYGDPYSAIASDAENRDYIKQSYGDNIKPVYTYFSLTEWDFRTCTEFSDGDLLVGYDEECYVMVTHEGIHDGIRNYAEEKMLSKEERVLADVVSRATDAYSVLYSDIVFEDGELLSFDENPSDYYNRTNHVVGLYSIIESREDFEHLALDCMKTLQNAPNFTFGNITLCAGTASEAKYFVSFTPKTSANEISSLVKEFENNSDELYGICENDFLKYWN